MIPAARTAYRAPRLRALLCFVAILEAALLTAALFTTSAAQADWMSLTGAETAPTIAEIYVLDDGVRVMLEVYVGDLMHFEALIPDAWTEEAGIERPPLDERMRRFSDTGLQFITDTGEKLQARLALAEPRLRVDRKSPFAGMIDPMTRRPLPDAPADKRVLYAELSYPFGARQPQALTMVPPSGQDGLPLASIGFIAYHKSVPIIDFRYLSAPSQLLLDWDDPWYSRFENPNLKRHHASALMSFLYVEPYEVRHEILTRVRDLKAWMDLGLRGDAIIEIDELAPLKERIGAFLLARNPVHIDGEPAKAILAGIDFVRVGLTGIQLIEQPEPLDIDTAIVGVIISYSTGGLPQRVTLDWELFTDQIQRVPATATDPAGPLPTYLTPDAPVHTWTNYLKTYRLPRVQSVAVASSLGELRLPWLTLLCALLAVPAVLWMLRCRQSGERSALPLAALALLLIVSALAYPAMRLTLARPAPLAGELSPAQARELLAVLLKNVYRAFDFRDEEDVYDKLAISVSGELLAELYLQNRRSFAIQRAGGARARIKSVAVQQAVAERRPGGPLSFAIRAGWTAEGSVGHWGHAHSRRNRYDAVVTVSAVEDAWMITDLEVLEEERIDPSYGGQTSDPSTRAATPAAVAASGSAPAR